MTWKRIFSPPAEVSRFDTGIRFTDILFGFVIRELFLRLQYWGELDPYVRWQLVAGVVLVLGSWIGFRRSLNRSSYELKFFNLPLSRFVLDQAMIIMYFRVATRTPQDPTKEEPMPPDVVMDATLEALLVVFGLYLFWDLLGIWMARARDFAAKAGRDGSKPHKYPKIDPDTKEPSDTPQRKDWLAVAITLFAGLLVLGLYLWGRGDVTANEAVTIFIAAAGVLLLYRFLKEIKTSLTA